jgi:hypothetical protein
MNIGRRLSDLFHYSLSHSLTAQTKDYLQTESGVSNQTEIRTEYLQSRQRYCYNDRLDATVYSTQFRSPATCG